MNQTFKHYIDFSYAKIIVITGVVFPGMTKGYDLVYPQLWLPRDITKFPFCQARNMGIVLDALVHSSHVQLVNQHPTFPSLFL
jgi:hypothetical protein